MKENVEPVYIIWKTMLLFYLNVLCIMN